ncbi:Transmembrane protease serine 2 [Blomia tropicalis]|nr:Transmembrane protease serine 2 [Blomia tropicalis]
MKAMKAHEECCLYARYESIELNGFARVVETRKVIKHEHFNKHTKDNDIALIQTHNMVLTHHAHYITLPEQGATLETSKELNISGFGYQGNDPPYTNNLQLASVTKYDQDLCKGYNPKITDNMFCAGNVLGTFADFCHGDNGGPGSNDGKLYGIMSWHKDMHKCNDQNDPGIYTDVTKYITWIHSKVPHFNQTES